MIKKVLILLFIFNSLLSFCLENIKPAVTDFIYSSWLTREKDMYMYHPVKAFDNDSETAWFEDSEDFGKYDYIGILLDNEIIIDEIHFMPGWFGKKWWDYNNRVKKLLVKTKNDEYIVEFEDKKEIQIFRLSAPAIINQIQFELQEVYRSDKSNYTAIAEIQFYYKNKKIQLNLEKVDRFLTKINKFQYQKYIIENREYLNKRYEHYYIDIDGDETIDKLDVIDYTLYINGKTTEGFCSFFKLIDLNQEDKYIEIVTIYNEPSGLMSSAINEFKMGVFKELLIIPDEVEISKDNTMRGFQWMGFWSLPVSYQYDTKSNKFILKIDRFPQVNVSFEAIRDDHGYKKGEEVFVTRSKIDFDFKTLEDINDKYDDIEYEIELKNGKNKWLSLEELMLFLEIIMAG